MIKYLIILFTCFSISAFAQVQPDALGFVHPKITVSNPHYIDNVSQFPSFYNGHGTDTFVVRIATINGGLDFGQDTGCTFINGVDVVTINGGIRMGNMQKVNLIGWGSDSTYGFKMVGGGTGGTWDGMQKGLSRIMGCRFTGASQGGVWIKQDPNNVCQFPAYYNQFPVNDPKHKYADVYQYLYAGNKPYDSIWFIHNKVDNCGGEGIYFGSTDYIMSNGQWERQVPCLGNARLAPTQVQNCRADSNDVDTTGRSGMQFSQGSAGVNSMSYNHIRNTGYEYLVTHDASALSQGAAIRVGWAWNQQVGRQMNVIGNYGDTSLIYFLDIAEASNVQSNNFGTHFGQVYYNGTSVTNPQQNPSGRFFAQNKTITIQQICNNNLLSTTGGGGVTFGLYFSSNFLQSGNHANGNNQSVSFLSGGNSAFDTDCGVIPPVDTGCVNRDTTFYRDSFVTGHFDSTFGYKDTTITTLVKVDTVKHKNKSYTVKFKYNAPKDTVIRYLIRAAYDSVYICSLCHRVDTTICVPKVNTTRWGVLIPLNDTITNASQRVAKTIELGCTAARVVYNRGSAYTVPTYKDAGLFVSLTYNPVNTSMASLQPIPTDLAPAAKSLDSVLAIKRADHVAFFNEPMLFYTCTPQELIAALAYLVPHANAANATTSDGGELFGMIYYMAKYYNDRNYTDSLNLISTLSGISTNNLLNGVYAQAQAAWYSYIIPNIASTGVTYFNLHWYERPIVADSALTVTSKLLPICINFARAQTGLQVISDETWIRNLSPALLTSMFTEWKQSNPPLIIGYDGNGEFVRSNKQLEDAFSNFILNNP